MTNSPFSIYETDFIQRLTTGFPRSPLQLNGLQTADAELICLPGDSAHTLAITIDSIVEEIESGLYANPFLAGWMTVMASLSDLAAVGAHPLGVVLSQTFPTSFPADTLDAIQSGIRNALTSSGTFLLGGDTNNGAALLLTGCALGIVENPPISRLGASPGDTLYASGLAGSGNAFALSRLQGDNGLFPFKPVARLNEGAIVSRFGSCCMDSSDGVMSTLDQLMRLNGVGFSLDREIESILDPASLLAAKESGIAPWLLLAGCHGEFELIFTIPRKREMAFLETASAIGWSPTRLGMVINEVEIRMRIDGRLTTPDSGYIRNLGSQHLNGTGGQGIPGYIKSLTDFATRLQKGGTANADNQL